ncbi:MAG: RHS repeat domain-containing protein, partial [Candidatus Dojkabacteria bacterium]
VTLPGIRMKKDSSTETLSIYSSTGNLLATESSSIRRYDPFGSQINQTSTDEGFGASAQREYEKHFSIEVMQMGARIYVPTLGRFLQVDPVEGGNANDYVYPTNPINSNDFTGRQATDIAVDIGLLVAAAGTATVGLFALAFVGLVAMVVVTEDVIDRNIKNASRDIQAFSAFVAFSAVTGATLRAGATAGAASSSAVDNIIDPESKKSALNRVFKKINSEIRLIRAHQVKLVEYVLEPLLHDNARHLASALVDGAWYASNIYLGRVTKLLADISKHERLLQKYTEELLELL